MPCRDEKIDGKIIRWKKISIKNKMMWLKSYAFHHHSYTVVFHRGHKVTMKMTCDKGIVYVTIHHIQEKRNLEKRQHVWSSEWYEDGHTE